MRESPHLPTGALPLRVEPEGATEVRLEALLDWLAAEREGLAARLLEHGAILLRGFAVEDAEGFARVCAALGAELQGYAGGDSPRTRVAPGVYTSTEYPAHLEIPVHNELSYAARAPARIFFASLWPADEGGETPLADSGAILRALDPAVCARFEERGVRYLRTLHGGFGLGRSWQQTFETEDRTEVERLCREGGIHFAWKGDALALRETRPALARHPERDETVWFNQADLWHVARLGERKARALRRVMGPGELPQHATFGDGSEIEAADLAAVRAAQRAAEVAFPWLAGDVLLCDNLGVAHGRRPFRGARRLLAAVA